MGRREHLRHMARFGTGQQGDPPHPCRVEHRDGVLDLLLVRRRPVDGIRKPHTPAIEHDHSREAAEPAQEPGRQGVVPLEVEVRCGPHGEEKVDLACSEDLVRDTRHAVVRVASDRTVHPSIVPGTATRDSPEQRLLGVTAFLRQGALDEDRTRRAATATSIAAASASSRSAGSSACRRPPTITALPDCAPGASSETRRCSIRSARCTPPTTTPTPQDPRWHGGNRRPRRWRLPAGSGRLTAQMPRVEIGRHSLALGGPGGTLIESGAGAGEDPADVAEALSSPRIGPVAKQIVDGAEEATARAEEAVEITRDYLAGTLGDPAKAADRIDVILSVLERLDRDGNHKEALELARAVNGVLALFYRWADLVRSLGIAGRAAKKVEDFASEAWVEHELGTLHLAAGDPGEGVRHLCEARRLRSEKGLDGLEATEANLGTFCRQLRGTGDPPPRRRWLLAAAAALLLLLLGGGMGVVLASDDELPPVGTALLTVERD